MPISTIKFIGSENKAARDRSFCRDKPRTIQSPRNTKPIAINELVHEKLRVPCAILFSHSLWLGLSNPRLLAFKSSSVNSNMLSFYFHFYFDDPVQPEIPLGFTQMAMCF